MLSIKRSFIGCSLYRELKLLGKTSKLKIVKDVFFCLGQMMASMQSSLQEMCSEIVSKSDQHRVRSSVIRLVIILVHTSEQN